MSWVIILRINVLGSNSPRGGGGTCHCPGSTCNCSGESYPGCNCPNPKRLLSRW